VKRATLDATSSEGSEDEAVAAGRDALRGFAAFAAVFALGQVVGLAEFAASGGAYRLWTWVKVGGLYLVSFFGVSERVDLGGRPLFQLHLPLMMGTFLAGWLLFRAGSHVAARSRAATVVRVLGVVGGFAVPVWILGSVARLRFPDLGGPGVDATLRAITWQVIVFPAAFGLAAVGVGAWWVSQPRMMMGATARRIAAGGWRMCWLAALLAFAGLLILATIRSARTAQYGGWLGSQGRGGALLLGHQVLAVPNQSLFVLTPAMGGTIGVSQTVGSAHATSVSLTGIGPVGFAIPGVAGPIPARPLGGFLYLFMLVPALATVVGGRRAAEGVVSAWSRLGLGMGSGMVFAASVAAGASFASVQTPLSRAGSPFLVRVEMPATALLALAWGIGGGVVGALLGAQLPIGEESEVGVDPPLKPTSA
jgi:hypothetical protein